MALLAACFGGRASKEELPDAATGRQRRAEVTQHSTSANVSEPQQADARSAQHEALHAALTSRGSTASTTQRKSGCNSTAAAHLAQRLQSQLTESAPVLMTCLSLEHGASCSHNCYQNPQSKRFYGDLCLPAANGQQHSHAQSLSFLESLFSLEGKACLQEMRDSVLGGSADGSVRGGERSWQRVMRVPRSCRTGPATGSWSGAEDCACWHQLFVRTCRDEEDGRLLLMYQTDVTPLVAQVKESEQTSALSAALLQQSPVLVPVVPKAAPEAHHGHEDVIFSSALYSSNTLLAQTRSCEPITSATMEADETMRQLEGAWQTFLESTTPSGGAAAVPAVPGASPSNDASAAPAPCPKADEAAPEASFIVVDIAGFSRLSSRVSQATIASLETSLASIFADLCGTYHVQRIKPSGKARPCIASAAEVAIHGGQYSWVSTDYNAQAGAAKMLALAKDLLTTAKKMLLLPETGSPVQLRIGIFSSSNISAAKATDAASAEEAGGVSKPSLYNALAAAMHIARACAAGSIHISASTLALLVAGGHTNAAEWQATRGGVAAKRHGTTIDTYLWLDPSHARPSRRASTTGGSLPGGASGARGSSVVTSSLHAMGQLLLLVNGSQAQKAAMAATSSSYAPDSTAGAGGLTTLLMASPAFLSAGHSNESRGSGGLKQGHVEPRADGIAAARGAGGLRTSSPYHAISGPPALQTHQPRLPFNNFSGVLMEALKSACGRPGQVPHAVAMSSPNNVQFLHRTAL